MGDLVFALPAVEALRREQPQASIEWLVEDKHANLLKNCPFLDKLHIFPRQDFQGLKGIFTFFKYLKHLKELGKFDVIFDLQGNAKSALQLVALESQYKIGGDKRVLREYAHCFHHHNVKWSQEEHRSTRDLKIIKYGFPGLEIGHSVKWDVSSKSIRKAQAENLCLLHTSTSLYGQDKDWGEENWIALARAIRTKKSVALLHTPDVREKVERIAKEANVPLAPETPTIEDLIYLLDHSELLISTDSGPAHIAALRGNQVIALFGPTNSTVYAPPAFNNNLKILSAGNQDFPKRRNRKHISPLMQEIKVNDVLRSIEY